MQRYDQWKEGKLEGTDYLWKVQNSAIGKNLSDAAAKVIDVPVNF